MDAAMETTRTERKPRPIPVRAMGFPFHAEARRWWLFQSPIATHLSNGLNMLFPDGERFFIRSVRHYMDVIDRDPALRERVRGFFGQEGRHGHEHERFNRILVEQGYDIEPFLERYREIAYGKLEPAFPPHLRLAVTMAENALSSEIMDHADPVMRDLLKWHAAEEIEHKSVAYDVLQRVDPRWSTRALGLALAIGGFLAFWSAAARELYRQEEARGTDLRGHRAFAKHDPRFKREAWRRRQMFSKAIRDYLRPDFHPDQHENYDLARGYLESIGRLTA